MRGDEIVASLIAAGAIGYLLAKKPRAVAAVLHALVSEEKKESEKKGDARAEPAPEAVEKGPV